MALVSGVSFDNPLSHMPLYMLLQSSVHRQTHQRYVHSSGEPGWLSGYQTGMHHKFLLAFAAAFAGGCYAKLTATEVVSSLDNITQNILDLEVLVNSISKENATDLTAIQVGSDFEIQHASQLTVDGPVHRRQLPRPCNNQRE
jgi:hypothetical protein